MQPEAPSFPFQSSESRDLCLRLYDESLMPLGTQRTEWDVQAAGIRTRVVSLGPESGPPLLLVHGASASAAVLRNEIAWYAAAGFRVHAPDIPGHAGRSEPRALSLQDDTLGRWLEGVLDGLGIAQAHCIGYSLGGLCVLRLAQRAPARIRSAVIAVPGGLSRPQILSALPMLADFVRYRITKAARHRERMALRMCGKGSQPEPYVLEWVTRLIEHLFPDDQRLPVLSTAELAAIPTPILVCPGEQDPLFDWRATLKRARAMPQATLEVLVGCGHLFDLASLERFRARSVEFLRSSG